MYKKAYLKLFNAVTDALDLINNGEVIVAEKVLRDAQSDAESIIISDPGSDGDNNITVVDFSGHKDS